MPMQMEEARIEGFVGYCCHLALSQTLTRFVCLGVRCCGPRPSMMRSILKSSIARAARTLCLESNHAV